MKPAIDIQNLSKEYSRNLAPAYLSLREMISGSVSQLLKPGQARKEKFKALDDISFQVQPGERLGIIGRNGAGKSTLLKIISRITPPTTGKIVLEGRVGSLLEVGTGFHPELSGRENIFLNGSILGLRKAEIKARLDEIIAFSGVQQFIDTPLKHYSSGMQLRLAFAVAAHLEPEILLIDEVLAVGDLEFQKQCIRKMDEVSRENGRTVVFVSHNLAHLRQLCSTAVLLDQGKLKIKGAVSDVIQQYTRAVQHRLSWVSEDHSKEYRITACAWIPGNADSDNIISALKPGKIKIELHCRKPVSGSVVAFRITNQDQIPVLTSSNADLSLQRAEIPEGKTVYEIPLPSGLFIPGSYSLELAWMIPHIQLFDSVKDEIMVDIADPVYAGDVLQDGRREIIQQKLSWELC